MPDLPALIACADRECAMRSRVYPKWVAVGKMSQEKADHELACMREIKRILQAMWEDKHAALIPRVY